MARIIYRNTCTAWAAPVKLQKKGQTQMTKRKLTISNVLKITGFKRRNGKNRVIDYYLENNSGDKVYAFTRRYSNRTYEIVKGGAPVIKVLGIRSKDHSVMNLVNYLTFMMPYFVKQFEWIAA